MLQKDLNEMNKKFITALKNNIPINFYNDYLHEQVKIKEIANNVVFIIANSKFIMQIIETTYGSQFKQIIQELTQSNFKIVFLTDEEWKNKSESIIKKNIFNNDTGLKNNFLFSNYVEGDFNTKAYSAAMISTKKIGFYNPLFIYGNPGYGKTHLLKAIGNKFLSDYQSNNIKIKYIGSSKFGSELMNAIKIGYQGIENFKEKYYKYDVLLLDDIQFLATMKKTKEIFFQIFNHFITENKQIVIASDKHPNELGDFEERYISRFQSGLNLTIKNPSIEASCRIIKMKLKTNTELPGVEEDAIIWIAENFNSNIRNLEGAIKRLLFWTIQQNYDKNLINKKDAINALAEIAKNNKTITPEEVKKIVAKKYNTSTKKMISKQRHKNILEARQTAIFICRDLLNMTYKEIGKHFNRDHTTIMNSYRKINNKRNRDIEYKSSIKKMINSLNDKVQ